MYKTKSISIDTRVRTFWTLIFLSIALLVVYIYGVNATVRNTVARQNIESEVSNISNKLGEMEFIYISLTNKVSLQVAYSRGFKDVSAPEYISRTSGPSLSMNTRKR